MTESEIKYSIELNWMSGNPICSITCICWACGNPVCSITCICWKCGNPVCSNTSSHWEPCMQYYLYLVKVWEPCMLYYLICWKCGSPVCSIRCICWKHLSPCLKTSTVKCCFYRLVSDCVCWNVCWILYLGIMGRQVWTTNCKFIGLSLSWIMGRHMEVTLEWTSYYYYLAGRSLGNNILFEGVNASLGLIMTPSGC